MDYFRNTVVTPLDMIICGGMTLMLLVITGIAFALVGSSRHNVEAIDREIASLQQQIAEAKRVAARQDDLEDRIAQVRNQIVAFEARLPTQREIPKLLDSFQEVAAESGIQYQRIVAEAQLEQPLYVKLPFTIKVRGRYPQFGEFLKNLEFGERFVKVESLHVQQEQDNVSSATFAISTFTFLEDKPDEEGVSS